MMELKARKRAAEEFGKRPAPQGARGPGLDGKAGGMNPTLGRRFVSGSTRTEKPGVG